MNVKNGCARNGTVSEIRIEGTATPFLPDAGYGASGVFQVQFPGQPPSSCPGPNYVVQDIGVNADEDCPGRDSALDENAFAIVQSTNFTTLFLLSRNQSPSNASIEVSWGDIGTNCWASQGVNTDIW